MVNFKGFKILNEKLVVTKMVKIEIFTFKKEKNEESDNLRTRIRNMSQEKIKMTSKTFSENTFQLFGGSKRNLSEVLKYYPHDISVISYILTCSAKSVC